MSGHYTDDLLKTLGLESCKPVSTPHSNEEQWDLAESEQPRMEPADHSLYRRGVGLCMYVMRDRPDIAWTTRDLSQDLAGPAYGALKRLRRCARYMSGTRGLKLWCPQGPHGNQLEVYTDSDWA